MFAADRAVHVYGLADLDEPFWSRSRWWRDQRAVIGDVGVGEPAEGAPGIVYAIAAGDPAATLDLWAEVDGELADRYLFTGPVGATAHLAAIGRRVVADFGEHHKLVLGDRTALDDTAFDGAAERPGGGGAVRPLGHDDLALVADLRRHAADPASFFDPSLFDLGPHVGVVEDGELVAMAGIHVCSDERGVAAIGDVLVDPRHRRRGHGLTVTAAVARALLTRGITTIGLNVAATNDAARAVYRRLGFVEVHRYEEAIVERPA